MTFPSLKSKTLLSMALTFGLVFAGAFPTSQATELTDAAFKVEPVPAGQPSLLNRTLAIGAGAVGGLVLYSFATGDWVWAVSTMNAANRLVGMVTGSIATARVASGLPAAAPAAARVAGAAVPVAARVTGAAIPAARAAGTAARAGTVALAWRWIPITTSAIVGAFVGNAIYGKD